MRKFIRHPTQVPIDIDVDDAKVGLVDSSLLNISAGGLAFRVESDLCPGTRVTISMPELWPDYFAHGHVAWCREHQGGYEVGIQFSQADESFKARMVAQFCQIEDYKRAICQKEGRHLSSEEAAAEWIGRYAEEFADTIGWQ